jgi:RimJ/RimL family protein N-acetyltransferase
VVGSVMIWHSEHEGQPISEAGWMILPEHQGRGHASAAVGLLLERARADGRWGDIHAFPGATNAPSNALCRKFGFELIEQVDIDYAGRPLRCNHWVLRA